METNYSGWSKRREKARRRRHGKSPEERARIRAIRAEHYRNAAEQEAEQGDAPLVDAEKASGPSRDDMIEALKQAGQNIHPRIGDEKLTARYQELVDAQETAEEG